MANSRLADSLSAEAATIKAAAALGTDLTTREMAVLQAAHQRTPDQIDDLTSMMEQQLAAVAAQPAVSPDLCAYLCNHDDPAVALSAASNPATPDHRLDAIVEQHLGQLERGKLPDEAVAQLAARGNAKARRSMAYSTRSAEILRGLAQDEDREVRSAVAGNGQTEPGSLLALASDEGSYVRTGVARHAKTPVEALQMLASDPELQVRRGVARHRTAGVETLMLLSRDESPQVRADVATNENVPHEALTLLAKDDEDSVRAAVANNAKDEQILRDLFDETSARASVTNRALPTDLVDRIANESIALDENRTPHGPLDSEDCSILEFLGKHPNISPVVIDRLLDHAFRPQCDEHEHCEKLGRSLGYAARGLARQAGLTETQQLRLAEHPETVVRKLLAQREPRLTTAHATFVRLAEDADPEVVKALAANSAVPAEILDGLGDDYSKEVDKAKYATRQRERRAYEADRSKLQEWRDKRQSKRRLKKFQKDHPELHAKMTAEAAAIARLINGG